MWKARAAASTSASSPGSVGSTYFNQLLAKCRDDAIGSDTVREEVVFGETVSLNPRAKVAAVICTELDLGTDSEVIYAIVLGPVRVSPGSIGKFIFQLEGQKVFGKSAGVSVTQKTMAELEEEARRFLS